ncbi:YfbU family protein [Pseudomonas monsensis]
MIVSDAEKLILLMLSDLHEFHGIDRINTKLLKSALSTNNTWALNWEIPDLGLDLRDTPAEAVEVVNFMYMWGALEDTWHSFPENIKENIMGNIQIGKAVKFPGFHSSEESELYTIAKLFVDDMGKFQRYKGRDLNSHAPMKKFYEKMYSVFEKHVKPDDLSPLLPPEVFLDVFKAAST